MGIREELAPEERGKRTYLPPACYTMSKAEKQSFCGCLYGTKVPQGYSSKVKSLVSMEDLKLVGLKSHDYHVLMQQLLPVAIRGILPKDVRHTVTRLCFFFNALCSKVFDPEELDELENEGYIILCQLEMYFPPSFFDIMVHLVVHLVREIRLCGPIYLRWMYPVERYMKILKGYVKNLYRPEASIVQKYIAEESIEFCSDYLGKAKPVGLPESRHAGRYDGVRTHGVHVRSMGREEVLKAHFYILNNVDEVQPYLEHHKKILKDNNPRMTERLLLKEHNKTFMKWFQEQIVGDNTVSDTLKWLARGPNFDIVCSTGFDINNYSFYVKSLDDKSTVQNSGVMLFANAMHFSKVNDKNPILASTPYYGVIDEIWEVDYNKFTVPVFKCQWVNRNAIQKDEMGFTLVDLNRLAYTDEPFIMASQAIQVFYVKDPSNEQLSVVLQGKSVPGCDDLNSTLDSLESHHSRIPTFNEDLENEIDTVHATRDDHHEGIWENNPIPK